MRISSGLLMYSKTGKDLRVFIVHPGGPFWKKKDNGAWSIPKGEVNDGENTLEAAKREFLEETGIVPPASDYLGLGSIKLKSGKIIHVFTFEGTGKERFVKSNFVEIANKKTGKKFSFPEVDKGEYVALEQAKQKLHPVYLEIIERLEQHLQKD